MKKTFVILGRLWKVQTINYFRDVTNITLGIVLTTITMVCWVAFKAKEGGLVADPFVLASAMGISAIRNSQYNLNLTLTDWRFKGLFRNLHSTPLPKWVLLLSILIFNWVINVMVALLLLIIAMMFKDQRQIIQYVNWPIFIEGFTLNVLVSNVMALALTFFFKRRDLILVLSLFSYFGPMYLLGLGIPWNVSGNIEWLNDFLYIWPHRYTLAIMQSGWIWQSVPNLSFPITGIDVLPGGVEAGSLLATRGLGFDGKLWIPSIASIGWIVLFIGLIKLGVKQNFTSTNRDVRTYKGIDKHINYINQIRKSQSLTQLNVVITQINEENLQIRKIRFQQLMKRNPNRKKPQKGGDS